MLREYVQERLARLLAENRPRRAQPEAGPPPDRFAAVRRRSRAGRPVGVPSSRDRGGPPDFGPSDDALGDDDDPLGWVRQSSEGPAPSGTGTRSGRDLNGVPDQPDDLDDLEALHDPTRRRFTRAHVGVVAVLLVLGVLVGGWTVLRAHPVAIASTPSAPAVTRASTSSAPVPRGGSPSAAATPVPEILVHVLGAVQRPGVVTLPDRSRVRDAVRAAGGLRRDAAPGELNLAQVLADGEQILIGTRKKPAGQVRDSSAGTTADSSGAGTADGPVVDLNRATATQLEELPGVGPVTAGKILSWRQEHTRFSRVEELQEVDGIGPKTYAQIAPHVRV